MGVSARRGPPGLTLVLQWPAAAGRPGEGTAPLAVAPADAGALGGSPDASEPAPPPPPLPGGGVNSCEPRITWLPSPGPPYPLSRGFAAAEAGRSIHTAAKP